MQCLRPYVKIIGHDLDSPVMRLPCGKCLACRINYTRQWTLRLLDEAKTSRNAFFLTLTYDDDFLPRDDNDNPSVSKRDCQLFFKRLRKKYNCTDLKYFLGSEYGESTLRPHYHAIVFNLPEDCLLPSKFSVGLPLFKLSSKGRDRDMINRQINDIWQKGFVEIGTLCRERVSYCAKYFIYRKDIDDFLVPNFRLLSNGLGKQMALERADKVRFYGDHLLSDTGKYVALPRYYRNKIYSQEERSERFEQLLKSQLYSSDELEKIVRIDNYSDEIEKNLYRSMTWKGTKRKL